MVKAKPQTRTQPKSQLQHNAQPRKKAYDKDGTSIVFYLLLPLLFLAPFFRGLFFYDELLIAHMYTAVIAGVYFYQKRNDIRFSRNLMDYAGVGLVIAYLLSAIIAVNTRNGIGLFMKMINYVLIYWLVAQTVKNLRDMQRLLTVLLLSGVGVALIGIGSAYGTFDYNGAVLDDLISSTLQYHNAAAIFLYATGMIGLGLVTMYPSWQARVLTAGAIYLIFITGTGAGSRGAMLVVPIAMLMQFIGLPRAEKEKYFYTVISMTVPILVTAKSAITIDGDSHWGILFLGFVLACLIQFGFEKFTGLAGKTKRNYLISAGVLAVALIIAVLAIKGPEIMPTSLVERAKEINFSNFNVLDRFNFYSDAMKIVKDNPVLGVGGGGWNSIYRTYQSYWYDTTEVHSHPLQVWVETGTFGFAFYVLLWLGLLISAVRLLRSQASVGIKVITWTAFTTALAIGMHSAIDFTLSLSAVVFFLFALMGLVRSGEQIIKGTSDNYYFGFTLRPVFGKTAGIILTVAFLAASTSFFMGGLQQNKAIDAYNGGDMEDAISAMEMSTTFDPFSVEFFTNLSTMYTEKAQQDRDPSLIPKALEAAKLAAKYDSGSSEVRWNLAREYYNNRELVKGMHEAEEAVARAPFVTRAYVQLALYYYTVAEDYARMGDMVSANNTLDKVFEIPERMQKKAQELNEQEKALFKGEHLDQIGPDLKAVLDKAEALKANLK